MIRTLPRTLPRAIRALFKTRAFAYIAGMDKTLHIVGGGMAGSEAAWQAAEAGVRVVIHEMRPEVGTFAHKTGNLAEVRKEDRRTYLAHRLAARLG